MKSLLSAAFLFGVCGAITAQDANTAQRKAAAVHENDAHPSQVSGTVVDSSGALLPRVSVQVWSANGAALSTTQTDRNGAFTLSGLLPGWYRIVVSKPDFGSREISLTITTSQAPPPLRIALMVSAVSTTIDVKGRESDLLGIASSASQGTVGATEIGDRPILRSGEVLETVPGVIITQHAGGGKANQYFLRGFNLDHGTDFAIFLDGMPLNLPSHAHGEGYADMNTVIPEFVERVNYEKGPYYADVGNYGSAGSAHLEFFKTLPQELRSGGRRHVRLRPCRLRGDAKARPGEVAVRRGGLSRQRSVDSSRQLLQIQWPAYLQPGARRPWFQHDRAGLPREMGFKRSDSRIRRAAGWFLWHA